MSAEFTFLIIVALVVYGHLDLYFSHAEEACDEKYQEALNSCKGQHLNQVEKKFYKFFADNYDSKGIGALFMVLLVTGLPRRILSIIVPIKRDERITNKSLMRVGYFWSMSHIYRSTPIAIICTLALTLHRMLMVFQIDHVKDLVDGHAEGYELYHLNKKVMDNPNLYAKVA